MASFNKINQFTQDLCNAVHNFHTGGATYKLGLTNTAPTAGNKFYSDIVGELSTANGYIAGGTSSAMSDSTTSGTEKVLGTNVTWTSVTGNMGPFRYIFVYRSDDTNKELVCWYDYGSSITLNGVNGDTFQVQFDGTNGFFTVA